MMDTKEMIERAIKAEEAAKSYKTVDSLIASIEAIEKGHQALDEQVSWLANILLSAGFELKEDQDGGRAIHPGTDGAFCSVGLWGEDTGLVETYPVGTPLSAAIVVALTDILATKRDKLAMRNRQIRDLRRSLRK